MTIAPVPEELAMKSLSQSSEHPPPIVDSSWAARIREIFRTILGHPPSDLPYIYSPWEIPPVLSLPKKPRNSMDRILAMPDEELDEASASTAPDDIHRILQTSLDKLTAKLELNVLSILRSRQLIHDLDLTGTRLLDSTQVYYLLKRLEKLEHLRFTPTSNIPAGDERPDLVCLAALRGIADASPPMRSLDLRRPPADALSSACLRLTKLEGLAINASDDLTDAHLEVMAHRLHSLRTLSLRYCQNIRGSGISALIQSNRDLHALSLDALSGLDAEDWYALADSTSNLRVLTLGIGLSIPARALKRFIQRNPGLQVLSIACQGALKNTDAATIGRALPELQFLSVVLSKAHFSGKGLVRLVQQCKRLKHLEIEIASASDGIFLKARRQELMDLSPALDSLHFHRLPEYLDSEVQHWIDSQKQVKVITLSCCGNWWESDKNGYHQGLSACTCSGHLKRIFEKHPQWDGPYFKDFLREELSVILADTTGKISPILYHFL